MTELIAMFLAGLALFFHGVAGIKNHLQGLTSRRLRRQLAKWAEKPWLAGLGGLWFGAITQSSTAVAFILTGMAEGGLIRIAQALPIVAWANLGTVLLVVFAALDLELAFLYLLGVSGVALAFDWGGSRSRPVISTLFCVGVLYLGLQMMKSAFAPLPEFAFFHDLVAFIHGSYFVVFVFGAVLRLLVQSSSGIAVIAISLAHGGLLQADQAAVMVFGTGIGVSLSIALLGANLQGVARRISLFQAINNGLAATVMIALFVAERLTDTPLVTELATRLTGGGSQAIAVCFAALQATVVLLSLVIARPAVGWLERLAPATVQQDLARPHHISERALEDPETALELAGREQVRLLHLLRRQLSWVREPEGADNTVEAATLHQAGQKVGEALNGFLQDLVEAQVDETTSALICTVERRQVALTALNESMQHFVETQVSLNLGANGAVDELMRGLNESLDTLLLTAIEAAKPEDDGTERQLLHTLTADRGELMERLRTSLLVESGGMAAADKSQLSYLTSLFERQVWLLRQFSQTLGGAR